MIENIGKLLVVFREAGRRVVFTRHGSQLPDGSDLVQRRRGREANVAAATTGDAPGTWP